MDRSFRVSFRAASRVKRDAARRGEYGEDEAQASAVKRQHALTLENDKAPV